MNSLPNIITLARLVGVPVIVWLILSDEIALAMWVFILAGISDAVDGFLAKRFNWESETGAYLDPIADKALLVCIYVALGVAGELPNWLVILVVSRDVLIIGAVVLSWIIDHPLKIEPSLISKVNTTAQIMLAAVVLAVLGFEIFSGAAFLIEWGSYLVAVTTVWSGGSYLVSWVKSVGAWEQDR